jgi:hypothetical protein
MKTSHLGRSLESISSPPSIDEQQARPDDDGNYEELMEVLDQLLDGGAARPER